MKKRIKSVLPVPVILIVLILVLVVPVVRVDASPGYEDFTEFTEIDPGDDIAILNSTHITYTLLDRNVDAYTYRYYGEGVFEDFEHEIEFNVTYHEHCSFVGVYCISNETDDFKGLRDNSKQHIVIACYPRTVAPIYRKISLYAHDGTNNYQDTYENYSLNKWYYLTIKKDALSVTCKIYNDTDRTDLIDTLSVTLGSECSYGYVMTPVSFNSGISQYRQSGVIRNLDLGDYTPPSYSEIGHSSSISGLTCYCYCFVTDNEGLHYAILSHNKTGTWSNETAISLTGTSDIANVSVTLGTANTVFAFKWYINDTSNNWVITTVVSFKVQSAGGEGEPFIVARFTFSPSNPPANYTINFNGSYSNSSETISSYLWNFGDGGSSELKEPTHKYLNNGTYNVNLTVISEAGQDTFIQPITVGGEYIINKINYPALAIALIFSLVIALTVTASKTKK